MKIAIFGGTGFAGSAIAEEAEARGIEVVRVSRSAEGPGTITGSILDASVINAAADDTDAFVIATHAAEAAESYDQIVKTCVMGAIRLGYVGGAGSLLVSPQGPRLIDTPEFPDEFKAEASLHSTGILDRLKQAPEDLNWFYVSPAAQFGSYTNLPPTGRYQVGGEILLKNDDGVSQISGADFAAGFVDELQSPKHLRQRFTLAE